MRRAQTPEELSMTLTIDVPLDVEQALEERARQSGQSLPEFAAALLAEAARNSRELSSVERQAEIAARLAALERIGSYDTRGRLGLPSLSDQDISRDSLYEGRGQ
jgi:hypothetical protein